MITEFFRKIKKITSSKKYNIDPDEIFLDSSNLPAYDRDQFEGRIEQPISSRNIYIIGFCFLIIVLIFVFKVTNLQIILGKNYADKSANNRLRHDIVFAHRGVITDRNGSELAWNEVVPNKIYPERKYIDLGGFSNLLGFIKYPQVDSSGFFYTTKTLGQDGVEKYFDKRLAGENGVKLTEVNVRGEIQSESTIEPPKNGETLTLSIDSRVQQKLYENLAYAVTESGFVGGAGVFMSAKTGEVISLVTYPEYNSAILSEGTDKKAIQNFLQNKKNPFLDRAISGLYAPGSTVKPFIALGVLNENIIDPRKNIYSSGSISLPNPYDPDKPSIFKDWKAHGYVDMRKALAVSSDVYFYVVGGGFEGQKGLGIEKIDEYLKKFLFTIPTSGFFAGPGGIIPTPEWKKETFNGEDWRIGDTYHTAIGQYGFQVTPIQLARAISGIANDGKIISPTIIKGEKGEEILMKDVTKEDFIPIKEGMRMAVEGETARALDIPGILAAAKTGTAEVGARKEYVNSWIEGFIPYNNPEYVFVVVLERGPINYSVSAMQVMGKTLSWMKENAPEYIGNTK